MLSWLFHPVCLSQAWFRLLFSPGPISNQLIPTSDPGLPVGLAPAGNLLRTIPRNGRRRLWHHPHHVLCAVRVRGADRALGIIAPFAIHKKLFLAIQFHFGAAILCHQHAVAFLDLYGSYLAVVIPFPRANGANNSLGGFLFGGIRYDDSALLDFVLLGGFHQNVVAERFYFE